MKTFPAKTISAIRFGWYGLDAFGDPANIGPLSNGFGGGYSDTELKGGKKETSKWSVITTNLKKVVKAWVTEVAFEDGTKWKAQSE